MLEKPPLEKLLDILFSHNSNFGKISLKYIWGCFGENVGPDISYYDDGLNLMPEKGMDGFPAGIEYLQCFLKHLSTDQGLLQSRKVLEDGFLANKLEMLVYPDRRVEMLWGFDFELDRAQLEKRKKYKSQKEIAEAEDELAEYFEHKGMSRGVRRRISESQRASPAAAPSPVGAPTTLTIPELFQAIVNAATDAAPKGWTKVAIDGQVWVETDASGRNLNNVSADFQAQLSDGSVRQINPEQPIAAMNALTMLNKQLPNHEGKQWRRLRVVFESTGPMQVAYDFDQAGLWRPES